MLHFYALKHGIGRTILTLGLLIVVFSFVSTACGTNSASGAASDVPTVVQPTLAATAGYGTSQGCPSNAVVSSPTKATITVLDSNKSSIINAHRGDVIEFRLSFGKKWSGPTTSQGGLELQTPAGYAVKTSKACVWDFVAKSTGTTALTFNSQALCKRGEMCPMFIAVLPFTVQVK